ncbi:hypothetical protein PN482_14730 [Microcystis aeruginosa CS-555/01A07]|nr:hypothetical protein [Microcystis aeruginosa]MDB9430118.1 hypothetical protein [Microcystis aeruginosa CS-555/01A07]
MSRNVTFFLPKRDESNGEFLSSRLIDRKVQSRSTLKPPPVPDRGPN